MVDQLLLPLPQRALPFLQLEGAFFAGRSHVIKSMKLQNAESENEA